MRPESAVQIWVADRLRLKQGRAYSVEREPEVVEGKTPDIRLQARNTNASMPIEIKVAESWSLPQLEDALNVQLGGRYLRAQDAHHGVLLVVHQKARKRGWRNAKGRMLAFPQVIEHLQRMADATAAIAPDAPQARIALLDVSDIQTSPVRKRGPKPASGSKRKTKKAPKAKSKPKKSSKSKKRGTRGGPTRRKKSAKRSKPAKPK